MAAFVTAVDISQPMTEAVNLHGHTEAFVLVRHDRHPLGRLWVPCPDGTLHPADLYRMIASDGVLQHAVLQATLGNWLLHELPAAAATLPSWSVIVCTRNRTEDLRRCLDSLLRLSTPGGEIVIVDNAPSDTSTAELVAGYPVRYVREDRVGLNWARSCGANAATGEIVIYTDDDVVVEHDWVSALLEPFSNPRVAAATGLTMPLELETPSQVMFEAYSGFSRGFKRRVFDNSVITPAAAGNVGAGANMAIRRELVTNMHLFDVELDCGTVTRTGGDNYAFYLLLMAGYQIVYTPDALTWHRHRRDYDSLRRTLRDYSVGGFAYLTRCLVQHHDLGALTVAFWWFRYDHLRQLKRSLLRKPGRMPLRLALAQIAGCAEGPRAYFQSRPLERAKLRAANTPQATGVLA